MRGRARTGLLVLATSAALASCSPPTVLAALLPEGVADDLPRRRLTVVWAPEMTACAVCNAPVAEALERFVADYPEAAVATALVAGEPFPEGLVVGERILVDASDPEDAPRTQRPYLALVDADRQLLGWRRISEFGLQDDLVYRELLSAYSLTVPIE